MKIHEVAQGTPEWHALRLGIPTASNFDKLITTKGEPSKSRTKYLYQIVGERLSGTKEEGYTNAHMERGIQLESEARSFYEVVTGNEVQTCGFVTNDEVAFGCSPDGLVGSEGLIEIKCPSMAVHVGYLADNKAPTDYFQQLQGQLFVTERKWVDFISYYPSIPPLIIRVEKDVEFCNKLKVELERFAKDADRLTEQLKRR